MSEPQQSELARRLLARARDERPQPELLTRVRALGHAEQARALAQGRTLRTRARWGAAMTLAAVVASGWFWIRGNPPSGIVISAEQSQTVTQSPRSEPSPALVPRPSEEESGRQPEPPSAADAGRKPVRPRARREVHSTSQPSQRDLQPTAPRAPEPSLSEQVELIRRAREALRSGSSERALELIARYQTEMRGTALAAEARLLQIEALASAGRSHEASTLARQFASEHPNSPLIDRARSFVQGEGARKSSSYSDADGGRNLSEQ